VADPGASYTNPRNPKTKQSLAELVSALPSLVVTLVKDELTLLKSEVVSRVSKLGIGAGLIAAALFLLFFVFAVLVAAAVLGIAQIKKGVPPVPEESITSLKKDVNAVKGLGETHE
jgi:hypothetical protein